jgi:hypothetical protein
MNGRDLMFDGGMRWREGFMEMLKGRVWKLEEKFTRPSVGKPLIDELTTLDKRHPWERKRGHRTSSNSQCI